MANLIENQKEEQMNDVIKEHLSKNQNNDALIVTLLKTILDMQCHIFGETTNIKNTNNNELMNRIFKNYFKEFSKAQQR
jgi:hypothetical protein